MTDYSINPIILKEGIIKQIDNTTKIRPVYITTIGKVSNIKVYFEANIKSDMLAIDNKGVPWEFKHYTEKHPLLMGDIKKGKKKRIWLRNKKRKNETIIDQIYGIAVRVVGEIV